MAELVDAADLGSAASRRPGSSPGSRIGARRTLELHRPDVFVEVHIGVGLERFGCADDLLALIPSGYEILVSRTEEGPYRPLAEARDELDHHSRIVAIAPKAARKAE